MVLQPMGCGRVGHRHNTLTEAARDLYSLWPLHCALNAISALPNACCADVSLHGAGYPHEHHGLVQQYSKPDAHKPDAPQVWLAASLGRQTNTAVRSTASRPTSRMQFGRPNFPWHPHERCNPNDPISNLDIHARELHATSLRNHNIRHRKGLQRHHAQPSARNPQRLEDAYDTRNPGSLTRPRVQPRHEDTNDAG